jgi:P27 family predicted phage terminase small subunit
MAGYKHKNLKILEGTFRKDRDNAEAPEPASGVPDMPKGLSPRAKRYWPQLCGVLDELGVLTVADGYCLEVLCETFAEWKELCKIINDDLKRAATYETVNQNGGVMHRPYPHYSMRADAARRFQSLMTEFGLTPAARSKVKAVSKADEFDPWDKL